MLSHKISIFHHGRVVVLFSPEKENQYVGCQQANMERQYSTAPRYTHTHKSRSGCLKVSGESSKRREIFCVLLYCCYGAIKPFIYCIEVSNFYPESKRSKTRVLHASSLVRSTKYILYKMVQSRQSHVHNTSFTALHRISLPSSETFSVLLITTNP